MWDNLQIKGQNCLWSSFLSGATQEDRWSAEVLSAETIWAWTPQFQWTFLYIPRHHSLSQFGAEPLIEAVDFCDICMKVIS